MGRELYLMLGGMMGLLVRVKMGWWGFGGLMRRTSSKSVSEGMQASGHAGLFSMILIPVWT
jgi:hypothetical protein